MRKRRKQGLFRLFQKRRKIEKKSEPGLVRDPDLSIFIISKREEREKKREILTDADATAGGSTKLSFLTVLRINGSGTGHGEKREEVNGKKEGGSRNVGKSRILATGKSPITSPLSSPIGQKNPAGGQSGEQSGRQMGKNGKAEGVFNEED